MNSSLPHLLVGILVLWTGLALVSGHRPEFCSLPAVTGPCKARMPRFFYNATSKQCEKFIYGGCQGNKNNFETLQECRNACVEKPGTCPKANPNIVTKCLAKCADDWTCPGSEKCCKFNCLLDCAKPV